MQYQKLYKFTNWIKTFPDDASSILVLSRYGHNFQIWLHCFLALFIKNVTSQCACTHLCFCLDHLGTVKKVWQVLHLIGYISRIWAICCNTEYNSVIQRKCLLNYFFKGFLANRSFEFEIVGWDCACTKVLVPVLRF